MATFVAQRNNPLLRDWTSEKYGLPTFSEIAPSHFSSAFAVGMRAQLEELKSIATDPSPATFDNTIAVFDRCGGILSRTGMVFSNLCSSNSPPELQAVQLEMAPILAAHESKVFTFPGLFPRIQSVFDAREGLGAEEKRLTERIHLDFVRAGAKFDEASQKKYAAIMGKTSSPPHTHTHTHSHTHPP